MPGDRVAKKKQVGTRVFEEFALASYLCKLKQHATQSEPESSASCERERVLASDENVRHSEKQVQLLDLAETGWLTIGARQGREISAWSAQVPT